jgi:hypothetical protein
MWSTCAPCIEFPKVNEQPQHASQDEEAGESEIEDEMDINPYQLIPLIVQRVSESPSAGITSAGAVQPTLPGMRQLEFPSSGPI